MLMNLPVKLDRIQRGDVVALVSPKNPDGWIIKRVIGLPGDVIKTKNYKKEFVLIPPGHAWVEGDNHEKSIDSNLYGVVSKGPFDRLTKLA